MKMNPVDYTEGIHAILSPAEIASGREDWLSEYYQELVLAKIL